MYYRTANYAEDEWDVYYYDRNLLGDITAIYSENGTKLVSYVYDAWGNFRVSYHNGASSSSVVAKNPFRYRGYFYDIDLGFYYLQTRYYDPVTCRFISPDDTNYLGENGDLQSYNLYAYCSNNPIRGNLRYNLRGIFAPISNISSISSSISAGISAGNQNISDKNMPITSATSTPFVNIVSMTNYSTTLVDNVLFGMSLGNISHTITTQHNNSGMLYAYCNIGNSTSSVGVGFNLNNWYGSSLYVSSNIGIGSSAQITPYATFGAEVSILDGISFSLGTISGNVTNETTVSVGWGTLAFAYAVCGVIAATPIPFARAAAGVTLCVVVLIDVLN